MIIKFRLKRNYVNIMHKLVTEEDEIDKIYIKMYLGSTQIK